MSTFPFRVDIATAQFIALSLHICSFQAATVLTLFLYSEQITCWFKVEKKYYEAYYSLLRSAGGYCIDHFIIYTQFLLTDVLMQTVAEHLLDNP